MKTKQKRLLLGVFILLFTFFIKLPSANAACSVSVSSAKSAVVGSTFSVTTTVSSDVGSWYYVLGYDPSKVQLVSGSTKVVGVIGDSKTSSYKFKALKSGSATFSINNVSLASNSTNAQCSASVGSATVTMKTQAEIEASYSRNNNLGSLSVEGAELSPAFNKDVTEYSATLPVDTTKAKIIATAADSTASIAGAGEIDVVDGLNKIEIVVTAQHGEKKTYVINLTVQELDPIKVKVNGKNYTIVRKSGLVENIPVGFVETKITIENQEVVAYKSELTKLTLVALKDEEGDISLFIYDAKKKTYTSFKEAKTAGVNLLILNKVDEKVPNGFVSAKFKHNNITLNGYKLKDDKNNNYYLVYAQSLETGNKAFYLYDKKEGTFQRYYEKLSNIKDTQIKYLFYLAAGLLGLFVVIILFKIINKLFTSKERKIKKYQKKIDKLNKSIDNDDSYYEEDDYDIDQVDERPVIKKVEEDEYVVPKKSRKEKLKELEEAKKRLDKNKPKYKRVTLEDDDI